jgi:hypothetical protein
MTKKPDESQILIRLSPDLCEEVKRFAEEHERSLNGEVVWALRQYIEQQKKEEEKARMVAVIDQVKPLVAWKEEIECCLSNLNAFFPPHNFSSNCLRAARGADKHHATLDES